MPRYDFRCTACQWTFEVAISFDSDELPLCPQCGKKAAERVISPPLGIHFRGSGFYKTDSRPVEKAAPTPSTPHPGPLPKGEGMTAPHPDPLPKGEGTPKAPATDKKVV